MDFSKFSDADFEVKSWVNGALAAHKDTHTSLDVSKVGSDSNCYINVLYNNYCRPMPLLWS